MYVLRECGRLRVSGHVYCNLGKKGRYSRDNEVTFFRPTSVAGKMIFRFGQIISGSRSLKRGISSQQRVVGL